MVTIGTGIGTGVYYNGELIPNIEFGRALHTNGKPIEFWAGDKARKKNDLSLKKWAKRFDVFLHYLVRILSPDHVIIGGGLSKKYHKFSEYLTVDVPIEVAHYRNNAGIVGAAVWSTEHQS